MKIKNYLSIILKLYTIFVIFLKFAATNSIQLQDIFIITKTNLQKIATALNRTSLAEEVS